MHPATNINSSPPSGGIGTHNATPSTVPTMMSPESGKRPNTSVPFFNLPSSVSNADRISDRRNQNISNIYTSPALRPSAQRFEPGTAPVTSYRNEHFGPAARHVLTAMPNTNSGVIGSGLSTRQHGTQSVATNQTSYSEGLFSVDSKTARAFKVAGLYAGTLGLYETVAACYKNFTSLCNIDASFLTSHGIFAVQFSDAEDAFAAWNLTERNDFFGQDLEMSFLSQKDIAESSGLNPNVVSNHVSEYLLSVIDVGAPTTRFTHEDILERCQSIGTVKAIELVRPLRGATATYRVEWSNTRAKAIMLSGAAFKGFRLTIAPYTPDVDISLGPAHPMSHFPMQPRDQDQHVRATAPRTPTNPTSANHNVVDISRISLGHDVRTTIMLRNIPNRIDQATLKRLLDETSFGEYDFMYLRIDFANNCNVGYAFINFVDPLAIIAFARARAGQRWNMFQSDKVAEISYATIQGCDCLIQKFRNSSVMLERSAFRPKLYKTGNGPDAGTEVAFPAADNAAKLARSCDIAEHVGLYLHTTSSALITTRGANRYTAPPRNQPIGGVYAPPSTHRDAITFNRQQSQFQPRQQGPYRVSHISSTQPLSPNSLYAPREGQAYRERQRRQGSQYDRGTLSAENEMSQYASPYNGNLAIIPTTAQSSTQQNPPPGITHPDYNIAKFLSRQFQNLSTG